eukprot:765526-Hanusia_phi.AAC.2
MNVRCGRALSVLGPSSIRRPPMSTPSVLPRRNSTQVEAVGGYVIVMFDKGKVRIWEKPGLGEDGETFYMSSYKRFGPNAGMTQPIEAARAVCKPPPTMLCCLMAVCTG